MRDSIRPTIDTLSRLSARTLIVSGFPFQDLVRGFNINGQLVVIHSLDNDNIKIITRSIDVSLFQTIPFRAEPHGTGYSRRFFCPVTGRSCSTIYFNNNYWGSRYAHKLRHSLRRKSDRRGLKLRKLALRLDAKPAHNRRNQLRYVRDFELIRTNLVDLGFVPTSLLGLDHVFKLEADASVKRKRSAVRSQTSKDRTLAFAMDRGEPMDGGHIERLLQIAEVGMGTPRPRPDLPNAVLEEFPVIDICTILSRLWADEQNYAGWKLRWSEDEQLFLVMDCRSDRKPSLIIQSAEMWEQTLLHKINFGQPTNIQNRLFLQCPVRGSLHTKLFLREGILASASANRLKHRSQDVADGR